MKLKLNQKGSSKAIALIIMALVLVLAIGAGYWFLIKKDDKVTSTDNKTISKELGNECNKSIKDKDFCKFISKGNIFSQKNIIIDMSHEVDGKPTKTTLKYDDKGNSQIDGDEFSMISLNGENYYKDEEGWTKMPKTENTAVDTEDLSPESLMKDINIDEKDFDKDNYTSKGKEPCGNLTCFKYEISSKDEQDHTSHTTVWFDDKEYKMRKLVSHDPESGMLTMNYTYEKVTITEPSPVKEFNM